MERLNAPEVFEFPFTPYPIQHDFMTKLYEALENKKCGIFESPTGTGKSLSIICGAIKWLKDFNRNEKDLIEVKIHELSSKKKELASDHTDWLTSQAKEIEISKTLNKLKLEDSKITAYNKKISDLKETKQKYVKYRPKFANKTTGEVENVLEEAAVSHKDENDDEDDLIGDIEIDKDDGSDEEEDDDNKYTPVKIYICSRTHSQLSQLIGEIRKSPFSTDIRVASLASRAHYCINPDVKKLKSVHLINERCLDLQGSDSKVTKKDSSNVKVKKQKTSSCKCPYNKQQTIEELRDASLLNVLDVEDLVSGGKEFNACPYYSSRKAVEDAEVVLVPYNTVLHKSTREATGISIKNNVVIFDEAHNLMEALAQMYNAEVSLEHLVYASAQLAGYKSKYNTRLSAKNLLGIGQLIFIIERLKAILNLTTEKDKSEIFTLENFVFKANIDNFNMFDVVKFIRNRKLSQKLHSFTVKNPSVYFEKTEKPKGLQAYLSSLKSNNKEEVQDIERKPPPSNPILAVLSFLESLTYSYNDGRVMVHYGENKKLQFLLLNPSIQFKEIVNQARSVIVAGGTMKPMSEFKDRLFKNAGAEDSRITEFSCDHIISPENILPIIIPTGIKNEQLLFNFEKRFKMGDSLKQILIETCKCIKGGIVVFFPSYQFESWIWKQLETVDFKRPVFREPQKASSVDEVLKNYHDAVYKSTAKGALLLSVVGGKLSEGLNFSDDLGRCVIVVGLPYANLHSLDLKEKMAYLDKNEGLGAGNKFYSNLCMKSVNQCIGRAVRHKEDYATVFLLDERYDRTSTKSALPKWIQRSLVKSDFNEALVLVKSFFEKRKRCVQ